MPMANTPVPASPTVLAAPGVPPLSSSTTFNRVINTITNLVADAQIVINMFAPPIWGLFYQGFPVVIADSVLSVDIRIDYRISSAPQEQGSFVSYNKVATPYAGKITFAKGGQLFEREQFLASLFNLIGSLQLFDIVTPEAVYNFGNITHIDYEKNQRNGSGLLVVDVWLEEVRITGVSGFFNTRNASAADPSSIGTVTPTDAAGVQQLPAGGVT